MQPRFGPPLGRPAGTVHGGCPGPSAPDRSRPRRQPGTVRAMSTRLCLADRPRPPRRRGVQGRGNRRPLPRRGCPHRARVLHRRRGGRHPEPGHGHARGPRRPARRPAPELDAAAAFIGYDEVVMLGYRDSGMPDTPANARPDSFARPPSTRPSGRLVAVIRRERPQVIVTYGDDQQGYPHPDHLRVHEISVAAFDAAGDPGAYPEAGEALQPLEDVLRGLVGSPDHGHAREVPRARAWSRPSTTAGSSGPAKHDPTTRPRSTSRTTPTSGARRCWPTPPRSTRPRVLVRAAPRGARTVHPVDEYILARSLRGTRPGDRG